MKNGCKALLAALVLLASCEPAPPPPFKIGEIVRHKTGTQEMVVIDYIGGQAVCSWLTPDGKETDYFVPAELEEVR